jgi:non-ribosomal peptide synthetase component E (peptide arylation enzyme)
MREAATAEIRNFIDGVTYAAPADAARWIESGDWINRTVGEALVDIANRFPDRPAFISDERTIDFSKLEDESARLAVGLLRHGLAPGDRVIVQLGTTIETVVALAALYRSGLIPVCAIPQYREIEIGQLARLSGASGYLVEDNFGKFDLPAFAAKMQAELPSIKHIVVVRGDRPEIGVCLAALMEGITADEARRVLAGLSIGSGDVLSFQLSGGSTGVPKIIPRFHAEYLGHSAAGMRRFEFDGECRIIWPLPLLHNAAQLYAMMPPILFGSATVLMPRLDLGRMFELIESHAVTHAVSIGPVAAQIMGYPGLAEHNLSSMRMFGTMNGAHALEAHIGIPCVNFYGITEGLLLGSGPNAPEDVRHGSNGLSGAMLEEIKLIDPDTGAMMSPGADGELAFRGPSSLRGYYGAPQASAEAIMPDGFFRSGDIMRPVVVDGGTAYLFQGRTRDNINRGGEKIACEEVEALVAVHPDISEARLVAMPDPIYGEKGCIFIVTRPGAALPSVAQLGAFLVDQGLAKFKCPERVEPMEAFPVTRVGKLDRAALRCRIAEIIAREDAALSATI